jgi:hypothetical protein
LEQLATVIETTSFERLGLLPEQENPLGANTGPPSPPAPPVPLELLDPDGVVVVAVPPPPGPPSAGLLQAASAAAPIVAAAAHEAQRPKPAESAKRMTLV